MQGATGQDNEACFIDAIKLLVAHVGKPGVEFPALGIPHRYGRLEPGDRIVLVAAASAHREAAFEACHFLIDWLKTQAPFWKLEETPDGGEWVDARSSDDAAAKRWVETKPAKSKPDAAE